MRPLVFEDWYYMLVFLSFYFVRLDAKMIFSFFFRFFKKTKLPMQWTCKYCTFYAEKRSYLLKHYRLKHGCHTRISPLPCLHKECLCTFKSFNALKVHLSTWHTQKDLGNVGETAFHCQLCDFVEPCTEAFYRFTKTFEAEGKGFLSISRL